MTDSAPLRLGWIAIGWFMSAALVSLVLLAAFSFGFIESDTGGEPLITAVALLIGFFGGGFIVGSQTGARPVAHGVAVAVFSLVAWFAINLFLGEPTGETSWRSLGLATLVTLLAVQGVAAVVGAVAGVQWFLRTPD